LPVCISLLGWPAFPSLKVDLIRPSGPCFFPPSTGRKNMWVIARFVLTTQLPEPNDDPLSLIGKTVLSSLSKSFLKKVWHYA
jgi:hypothetical protein